MAGSNCGRILLGIFAVAVTVNYCAAAEPAGPAESAPRPGLNKLATVLAEMARAAGPQALPVPSMRTTPLTFALGSMPKSVRDAVQTRLMRINPQGEVQVYVMMNPVTDERLRELAARGVTVEIADPAGHRVQARVPVSRLEEVAGLSSVDQIRLPSYAWRMTGGVNSEGDAIMRSDLARAQLGLTGTGVKVGVISDGIKGVFATGCTNCGGVAGGPISTGDLPAATGTRNASGILTSSIGGIIGTSFVSGAFDFPVAGDLEGKESQSCGFAGAGAEGTALLEIVHDIAPAAQLSFANVDTDLAMIQAVNFLAASNDVVVDDLGFLGLPADGTSGVSSNTAAALNNPSNRIRGYYTSVGNGAFSHYFGAYTNSGVNGTTINGISTAGNLHRFQASADTMDVLGLGPQPYNRILLPPGGEVVVILNWNDPFGASSNNYDLYLVRESTNQAVQPRGTDVQAGNGFPVEFFSYINETGSQDFFRIVIQNVGNAAAIKNLNLFAFEPQCAFDGPLLLSPPNHSKLNFFTPTRSLTAQSDAGGSPVSVVSVGAICSASQRTQDLFVGRPAPFESCYDTTNEMLEFFSAQGPTLDGRMKPDVTGIDGVSVTGSGSFVDPFFGTSASAPHVAGLAAVALESAPCLIAGKPGALTNVTARTNLRNMILDNAVPLGGAVPNNEFGHGRADALASVQAALPTFGGLATLSVNGTSAAGASLAPSQLGFGDPNSCPLTTLNWSGGCGTGPGVAMPCPFGTSNISVSASNNGVSFSSPVGVQIIVSNFGVQGLPASQTVVAGDPGVYTITISAQNGAFTNSVTLACAGLPAETSCDFNPPAVTPGAGSATSTLTITTTPQPPPVVLGLNTRSLNIPGGASYLAMVALTLAGLISRRRIATATVLSGVLALLLLQFACGGGSGGNPSVPSPSTRLSVSSLVYGSQPIGTTSEAQSVILTNIGTATLNISNISAGTDFVTTNNCVPSVVSGGNCIISVYFVPTAAGARTGTLIVEDNAPGSPHSVSLSGTGLAGTAAGNYPITVSGTSGALVNSAVVTLDVH